MLVLIETCQETVHKSYWSALSAKIGHHNIRNVIIMFCLFCVFPGLAYVLEYSPMYYMCFCCYM